MKHPLNVYMKESDVLRALDDWLVKLFAPHRVDETIRELTAHQDAPAIPVPSEPEQNTAALLAACDAKLAKYRAALEAGVDPETLGEWIRTVKAERAAITAHGCGTRTADKPSRMLTDEEIAAIVHALTDIRAVIEHADAADKARVYHELGLRLTYDPGQHTVRAQVNLDPNSGGFMVCVRGGT